MGLASLILMHAKSRQTNPSAAAGYKLFKDKMDSVMYRFIMEHDRSCRQLERRSLIWMNLDSICKTSHLVIELLPYKNRGPSFAKPALNSERLYVFRSKLFHKYQDYYAFSETHWLTAVVFKQLMESGSILHIFNPICVKFFVL